MPYLKPGEVYEVQKQLVDLMEEFKTVREMYEDGEFLNGAEEFLERDPVTGDKGETQFMKVDGVWVNVENAMAAEKMDRPIDTLKDG